MEVQQRIISTCISVLHLRSLCPYQYSSTALLIPTTASQCQLCPLSNRSPSSAVYPSPPNSETLQHSEMAPQNGMAMQYAHASPPSPRDELARKALPQ